MTRYARAYRQGYADPSSPLPDPGLKVGDEVVDVGILVATGRSIVGRVVKLHKIDGVLHAVVRGPGNEPGAADAWVAVHPVARFRRVKP